MGKQPLFEWKVVAVGSHLVTEKCLLSFLNVGISIRFLIGQDKEHKQIALCDILLTRHAEL